MNGPDADFTLPLTRETWGSLYLDQATVTELARSGGLAITGDAGACTASSTSSTRSSTHNTLIPPIDAVRRVRVVRSRIRDRSGTSSASGARR